MTLNVIQKEMVEAFQCPGCVNGMDTTCDAFKLSESSDMGFWCEGHRAGTILNMSIRLNLGLPKGFCRVIYPDDVFSGPKDPTNIRLHADASTTRFDKFNVPVWAMEFEDHLFVRTYLPRTDRKFVEVIKGGKISEVCPAAILWRTIAYERTVGGVTVRVWCDAVGKWWMSGPVRMPLAMGSDEVRALDKASEIVRGMAR